MGIQANTSAASVSDYRRSKGLSLLEMLIGLALGLLILEWCCHDYVFNQKQWRSVRETLEEQRQLQTAFLSIKQDVARSGYRGLRGHEHHYPVYDGRYAAQNKHPIHSTYYQDLRVEGVSVDGKQRLPVTWGFVDTEWKKRPLKNSDAFTLYHLQVCHFTVQHDMKNLRESITINPLGKPCVLQGQQGELKHDHNVALISDIRGADVFRIEKIQSVGMQYQNIMPVADLKRRYGRGSQLSIIQDVTYFVARSEVRSSTGSARYALFRKVRGGRSEEILLGIDTFRVLYRVWQREAKNWQYKPAGEVIEWSSVSSMKLIVRYENSEKDWVFDIWMDGMPTMSQRV